MSWGYHIMLDCSDCDLEKIKDKNNIQNFVDTLIDAVNMQAHGNTIIKNLLAGTDNEGYSVLQMITTSNITCHFVNSVGGAYIDLFSCKSFDPEIVKSLVSSFFNPTDTKILFIERNA